jgi:hypothetical protein
MSPLFLKINSKIENLEKINNPQSYTSYIEQKTDEIINDIFDADLGQDDLNKACHSLINVLSSKNISHRLDSRLVVIENLAGTTISAKNPSSKTAPPPIEKVSCFKLRPSQIVNKSGNLIQVKVVKQLDCPGGNSSCGYHAWKNGLILLAMSIQPLVSEKVNFLLEDKFFFTNEVIPFLKKFNPSFSDIPLTDLNEATNFLMNESSKSEFKSLYPNLSKLVDLIKPINRANISFLNTSIKDEKLMPYDPSMAELVWEKDAIDGGGQASTISNILDSVTAIQNPDSHVFISGTGGHWVALLMEIQNNRKVTWFGTDSWENKKTALPKHTSIIDRFKTDQTFQKIVIKEELDKSVMSHIKPLTQHLDNKGAPLPPHSLQELANSHQKIISNIARIEAGLKLFKGLDLTNNHFFTSEYEELNKAKLFYESYLQGLPSVNDMRGCETFFDSYLPYQELTLENFLFLESVSSDFAPAAVKQVGGIEVDDLTPLEQVMEKLKKNNRINLGEYKKILEKYFAKNTAILRSELVQEGVLSKNIKNSQRVIQELLKQPNLEQMRKIFEALKKINKQKIFNFLIKNNIAVDNLSDNPNDALIQARKGTFLAFKEDISKAIDINKQVVKKKLLSQKALLLQKLI